MEPNLQNPVTNSTNGGPTQTPFTPVRPVAPITSATKPMVPTSLPSASTPTKKVGPIIATLVIVLILIIAALYFFASKITTETIPSDTSTTAVNTPAEVAPSVQAVTNTADDPASLQSDLNASTKGLEQQNF